MGKRRKNKEIPPVRRLFAERLRAARITKGYANQKDFAAALDIEAERYRMWERGDREPDITHLVKIAAKLEVSLDFLMRGGQDRPPLKRAITA